MEEYLIGQPLCLSSLRVESMYPLLKGKSSFLLSQRSKVLRKDLSNKPKTIHTTQFHSSISSTSRVSPLTLLPLRVKENKDYH